MSINDWVETYLNKPSNVLVVDDSQCAYDLVRMLDGYDCACTYAYSGSDAGRLVHSQKFDLIFLSITLPDMPGIDVLKEIKEAAPETPVVVMAGFFDGRLLEDAARLGVVSFLRKPIDFTPKFVHQILKIFKVRSGYGPILTTTS